MSAGMPAERRSATLMSPAPSGPFEVTVILGTAVVAVDVADDP